jgi:hypothetical protein
LSQDLPLFRLHFPKIWRSHMFLLPASSVSRVQYKRFSSDIT